MKIKRFFLVDCNNFYVSCERVFNPRLRNKPVVVLSNNDACVIARSNEAKLLGIAMGQPLFECRELIKRHNVITLSSNFALYGDMSARVMQELSHRAEDIEVYSIDEAFLTLTVSEQQDCGAGYYTQHAARLRAEVTRNTGIPVSIGIGSTKTLAKLANQIAKKHPTLNGVFDIDAIRNRDLLLSKIAVADIWGIGRRYGRMLTNYGINTVLDFIRTDERWIRKKMTVVGHKTWCELNGTSCLSLNEACHNKQTLCVSRSFGKRVTSKSELKQALIHHVTSAARKLRKQGDMASGMTLFASYRMRDDTHKKYSSHTHSFACPTNVTPDFIAAIASSIDQLVVPGAEYTKAGVMLHDFTSQDAYQHHLFVSAPHRPKQTQLMKVMDQINEKMGNHTIHFAGAGIDQPWHGRARMKSPSYTTNWNELLTIDLS